LMSGPAAFRATTTVKITGMATATQIAILIPLDMRQG